MRADTRAPAIAVLMKPEHAGVPLYTQLYRHLREHILTGVLAPGSTLPSARTLASDLSISRNTVEAAISQLRAEGFVARRVGAGTVVSAGTETAPFARRQAPHRNQSSSLTAPVRLSRGGTLLVEGGRGEIEGDARVGPCAVDVLRFPTRTWQRMLAREARRGVPDILFAPDPRGISDLREAICEHAQLTRGLRCTASQIVITNSAQQALDLVGRLLLAPGETALIEEPGYRAARAIFAATGATVRGIDVDDEGIRADLLEGHRRARLLYVTPSHQFPLGVTLSLDRRLSLLRWATSTGAWIVEDDYDSEFQYVERPITALQGLDRTERVIYVGTFNKIMFPGLRLGYVVLPPALVESFVAARRLSDGGSPPLMQAALAAFMRGGHFAAHLRRARRLCQHRRDLLVRLLASITDARTVVGPSATGLHLVVHLPPGADDVAISAAVAAEGIGSAPLSLYYMKRSRCRGILLSFGGATEAAIKRGVAAIASHLRRA